MKINVCALWSALCLCGLALSAVQAHAFDEDHKETINGTTLHFRVRGMDKANPYLLILHGGPGMSAHMYYPWGASLEKNLNVVYLDQRGCGESERLKFANPAVEKIGDDPKNYTMENLEKIVTHWLTEGKTEEAREVTMANLLRDIEGVRETLKVDKWYVLGHSWGGMLGLEYVSAHPEHVLGYIHMDGLVSMPELQDAVLDNAEAKFKAEAAGERKPAKEQAENLLKAVQQLRVLSPTNPRRFLGALGLAMGPAGLYFARDGQNAFAQLNRKAAEAVAPYHVPFAALLPAWEPLAALMQTEHYLTRDDHSLPAGITVPTLVLNGKQDGLTTAKAAENIQRDIKTSTLVLLDDCGHFPFAEQPDKTTSAVLDFVAAHSR